MASALEICAELKVLTEGSAAFAHFLISAIPLFSSFYLHLRQQVLQVPQRVDLGLMVFDQFCFARSHILEENVVEQFLDCRQVYLPLPVTFPSSSSRSIQIESFPPQRHSRKEYLIVRREQGEEFFQFGMVHKKKRLEFASDRHEVCLQKVGGLVLKHFLESAFESHQKVFHIIKSLNHLIDFSLMLQHIPCSTSVNKGMFGGFQTDPDRLDK